MADVTISYKNNEIATMNATGVKTLLTGDTFCEDDIVVAYTKPSTPAPTLQSKTVYPAASDQTTTPDQGYDGLSSVISKGVLLTNLTAGNIKKDVVVKVGDSADDDRITSVTGTYEGSGGGGIPANLSAFILFDTSDPKGPVPSTNRTAYFFETGMTWAQFVASSYNTGGFLIEDMTGMDLVCISPSRIGGTVDIVHGYSTSPDTITGSDTIAVGTYALNNFY